MRLPSQVVSDPLCAVSAQLRVEGIAIHLLHLPLNERSETRFGNIASRLIFLISVEGEGLTGWGEVVAAEEPRYSYETVGTAQQGIRDFLAPAVLSRPIAGMDDLAARLAPFRAPNIALARRPGFTLPGDISASSRYFARDLIVPGVSVAPTLRWGLRAGRDSESRLSSRSLRLTPRRLSASSEMMCDRRGQNEQL